MSDKPDETPVQFFAMQKSTQVLQFVRIDDDRFIVSAINLVSGTVTPTYWTKADLRTMRDGLNRELNRK